MNNPESPSGDARFAPPKSDVADVPTADVGQLELAHRGARFMAALLDGLILIVPLLLLNWLARGSGAFEEDDSMSASLFDTLLICVAFVAVNGWLLAREGQTVAKYLMGQRIVAPDGSRLPLSRLLLLRYLPGFVFSTFKIPYMVWSLADSLAIFQPNRRCLHDMIAGTIVVKA